MSNMPEGYIFITSCVVLNGQEMVSEVKRHIAEADATKTASVQKIMKGTPRYITEE